MIVLEHESGVVLRFWKHTERSALDRFDEFRTGLDHLAFEVATSGDIDDWAAHFEARASNTPSRSTSGLTEWCSHSAILTTFSLRCTRTSARINDRRLIRQIADLACLRDHVHTVLLCAREPAISDHARPLYRSRLDCETNGQRNDDHHRYLVSVSTSDDHPFLS